jgi:hypothetical protein
VSGMVEARIRGQFSRTSSPCLVHHSSTPIAISTSRPLPPQPFSKMKRFTALAAALLGVASGQVTSPFSSFPPAPVPTPPPGSQPDVAQLIGNIPSCWTQCVGGAIKAVCPSDDSWECACNAYENPPAPDFIQLAAFDPLCQNCSPNVGASDGGEQGACSIPPVSGSHSGWIIREVGADQIGSLDISGLLANICIALPDSNASAMATAETAAPTSSMSTTSAIATAGAATPTSSTSPQHTQNAAATIALQPWHLLVVPLAVFDGLALL